MNVVDVPSRPLFELSLEITERHTVGDAPFAHRLISHVTGGRFRGERLAGRVLPGSGDWPLVARDGTMRIDARLTLETDDAAMIYLRYEGIYRAQRETSPESYLRTACFFETSAPAYAWLNAVLAIGIGRRVDSGVEYAVHELL